jgi:hypothetical protein
MGKIKPVWRVLIVVLELAIYVVGIVGYQAGRGMDAYYLRVSASDLTPRNIVAGIIMLYLGFVVLSGRLWPPWRKRNA